MKTNANKAKAAGLAGAIGAAIVGGLSQTAWWMALNSDLQVALAAVVNAAVAAALVYVVPNRPLDRAEEGETV